MLESLPQTGRKEGRKKEGRKGRKEKEGNKETHSLACSFNTSCLLNMAGHSQYPGEVFVTSTSHTFVCTQIIREGRET